MIIVYSKRPHPIFPSFQGTVTITAKRNILASSSRIGRVGFLGIYWLFPLRIGKHVKEPRIETRETCNKRIQRPPIQKFLASLAWCKPAQNARLKRVRAIFPRNPFENQYLLVQSQVQGAWPRMLLVWWCCKYSHLCRKLLCTYLVEVSIFWTPTFPIVKSTGTSHSRLKKMTFYSILRTKSSII